MPRVLHLFNVFGALTERAMLSYVLGLSQKKWEVTASYEQLAPEAPPVDFPLVELPRILVEMTDDVPRQMRQISEAQSPAMLRLLEEEFDLVHGHFGPRILQGAAFLSRQTPMIVSVYGYDTTRLLRERCWSERYRWAAEQGAVFVALADAQLRCLEQLGIPQKNLRLIRLGIHLGEHPFSPSPAPSEPRFVAVGRFVEKKGTEFLLRALALLPENVHLDMVGSGPLEGRLRRLAQELRLGNRARFVGNLPFGPMCSFLHGATALVQPSVRAEDGDAEGAPMVLMDALSVGVPCVTTLHAGNPEVLPPEGRDWAVPERDPEALAAAMERMIRLTPAKRADLQKSGRLWIEEHYDVRRTVAKYDALYHELLAASGSGRQRTQALSGNGR